jgi:hypothetical protein
MTTHRITKPFHFATLTLAAFPLLLLVAFFGYVIEVRLHLGHWPSYANPDPKQLGWWFQHSVLQLGFVGFPVAALLATGLAVVGRLRSREFPLWTVIATVVVASAALVAFARIDPGGFVDWFWD